MLWVLIRSASIYQYFWIEKGEGTSAMPSCTVTLKILSKIVADNILKITFNDFSEKIIDLAFLVAR